MSAIAVHMRPVGGDVRSEEELKTSVFLGVLHSPIFTSQSTVHMYI